jgi:hypothetical protein
MQETPGQEPTTSIHEHQSTKTDMPASSSESRPPLVVGPQWKKPIARPKGLERPAPSVTLPPLVERSFPETAAADSPKSAAGRDAFPSSRPSSKSGEAVDKARRPRKPSARLIESRKEGGHDAEDEDGAAPKRARADTFGGANPSQPSLADGGSASLLARASTAPRPAGPSAAGDSGTVRRPATVTTDGTDVVEGGRDPLFVGCPIRIRRAAGDWSSGRILSPLLDGDCGERRQILLADGTRTTLRLYPLQARAAHPPSPHTHPICVQARRAG